MTADKALVVVDGRHLYPGHRHAWKRGRVVSEPEGHGGSPFVRVRLERRGRERTNKTAQLPAPWLLVQTPALLRRLEDLGLLNGRDDAGGPQGQNAVPNLLQIRSEKAL